MTFLLVMFTWVFFRAATTDDALVVLQKVLSGGYSGMIKTVLQPAEIAFCFLLIGSLLIEGRWIAFIKEVNSRAFWLLMPLLLLACYLFGVFTANQFIYFQF